MARPRLHPRRLYRATQSGFYVDQETGDELDYFAYQTILPDKAIPISLARQEKMVEKLASWGVFERLDLVDEPEEIERGTSSRSTISE